MPGRNVSLVRICASERPPFISLIKHESHLIGVKGTTATVLDYVAKALNYKYVLVDTIITLMGEKLSPGNWTGILGNVSRKECDILINPVTPTYYRSDAVAFPQAYSYYSSGSVLSGPPQKLTVDMDALLHIFQNEVWLALVLAVLVVPFLGYLLDTMSRRTLGSRGLSLGVHYCRFWAALLTQSQTFSCLSSASCVVLTLWMLSLFCLTSSYKGNVYSMITLPAKTEYIEKIPDLVKYPKLRIITAKNNYEEDYIKLSKDKALRLIWQQIQRTRGSIILAEINTAEVMGQVLRGTAAIVSSDTRNRNTAAKYCSPNTYLHVTPGFGDVGYSVPMRKDFPKHLREKLNIAFLEHLDTAHFQYHSKKDSVAARCLELPYVTSRPDDPIKLIRIVPALQLWGIGIATGFVSFIVEILPRYFPQISMHRNRSVTPRFKYPVHAYHKQRRNKRMQFMSDYGDSYSAEISMWDRPVDVFHAMIR